MKLDSSLTTINGSGIFKPVSGTYISSDNFSVNNAENTITVTGCQDSDNLTAKPSGSLVFGVVKIPDYLIPITPLEVKAYSDPSLQ